MMPARRVVTISLALMLVAIPAAAQAPAPALLAGVHIAISDSDQFHTRDTGLGGHVSWHPTPLVGVEGELTFFSDWFSDGVAFSRGRVEGLFGATIGPRLGAVRPFARARPGFLRYRSAGHPIPCLAIFPPLLSCTLAGGRTLPAFDIGGGLEIFLSRRAFARFDAGDRIVRFPSPFIDTSGHVRTDDFTGHDVRVALGVGLGF